GRTEEYGRNRSAVTRVPPSRRPRSLSGRPWVARHASVDRSARMARISAILGNLNCQTQSDATRGALHSAQAKTASDGVHAAISPRRKACSEVIGRPFKRREE